MAVPIGPSPLNKKDFHQKIDSFVENIKLVVDNTQKNNGKTENEDIDSLAKSIETLEENANQVLRDTDVDEDTIIDAQIILGILTQAIQPLELDHEISLVNAARDFKEKANDDLEEAVHAFSENPEEKERLMMTINQISNDVYIRCDVNEEKENV